jgi:hypothetical protein
MRYSVRVVAALTVTMSVSACVAYARSLQEPSLRDPDSQNAAPAISVITGKDMPVQLGSTHIVTEDGTTYVEGELNTADEAVSRVETTLVIYDANGNRRDLEVDDVAQDAVPLPAHAKQTFRIRLRTAVLNGDTLRFGVSEAETADQVWRNDLLVADADIASAAVLKAPAEPVTRDRSDFIVLNDDDAPVELIDITISRNVTGTPAVVHLTVRNRGPQPLGFVNVAALILDGRGVLRLESFGLFTKPIPGFGTASRGIAVNHVFAARDWSLVLAVKDVVTPTGKWENQNLKGRAQASLHRER